MTEPLDFFAICAPGLEEALADEVRAAGFSGARAVPGGVEAQGDWPEIWRANLELRGATRILVRIGAFRALHLAQLDKRARKFPWGDFLRADIPVKVEAVCRKSRIYHAGAAAQRIEGALRETLGAVIASDAPVTVKLRIEDDLCSLSLDSSGESLHRRGHKLAVNKAPMRETLAALFLRECGYRGGETVLDPMCGSGSFVIEAAEIAAGLHPGRSRSFAFEQFATFDPAAWEKMRSAGPGPRAGLPRFYGSDRDEGAIRMSRANAERAGVGDLCTFEARAISDLTPPPGAPGLVIANPPYGGRIGNKKLLFGLYGAFGEVMRTRFAGWRVGMVTSDSGLARATGLNFEPPGPIIPHGGLKIRLYQAAL
ncbi:MAG: class I SAM-dependent RNA methyltransferase [Paracoccus sp. (in: a-proteobacteria)]|nr:class I SAM-dependent RNA methyltransferase [Paracoccus sp. (in: a-proteobacteria)]